MDPAIQDFIKTKTALVVVAIDDYRNKLITHQEVSIFVDGEKPTLTKEGGYHIFLKLKPGCHHLSVGGWLFQQQDIVMDSDEEKESGRGMMKIRLQPNCHYLSGKGATILQGRTEPFREQHFVFINPKESYRLCQDYTQGTNEISICRQSENCHQSEIFLEGALFSLQKADGRIEEFWIEEAAKEPNRYALRYSLNDSYEKGKCILRRVYVVTADQDGRFYFPVPLEEESCEEYRCYTPLDKREIRTGIFTRGEVNDLEWEEAEEKPRIA